MRPLFVVNNFGQFNHLILRSLRDMEIPAELVPNTTPPGEMEKGCRGIILGGGPSIERAGRCAEYLDLGLPVLGICLGMQAMALARGGAVSPGSMGGYGLVEVEIVEPDEILNGYPGRTNVWASHMDEVTKLPGGFTLLASSRICWIEAMAKQDERLYGVQWHPEVSHTANGRLTFENFDRICREP
ncbi:MAG TPA: GMP synthase subunit A [Methanomicrobiales archaeon]|jgi:GMP synthase (glutamine-hydrolysing)|nr:GMP synthase subunit A [Methanomicrobiales archaeon]